MLLSKELLFSKITEALPDDSPNGVGQSAIASLKSKFKDGKLSISFGLLCKLAAARGINPTIAALSLLYVRLTDGGRDSLDDLVLAGNIKEALDHATTVLDQDEKRGRGLSGKKTLSNFPWAFNEPFVVVTGDRRETSGRKMTPSDFGALSSSAADLRYLSRLGLPRDTDIITDKVFALAPYSELCRRFSQATLVCIGSPASNHLCRILNRYSIHRFNLAQANYEDIEDFIKEAWTVGYPAQQIRLDDIGATSASKALEVDFFTAPQLVPQFDYEALEKYFNKNLKDIRYFKHSVFEGGLVDPTYSKLVRGKDKDADRDFAIITMAQNPFRTIPHAPIRQLNDGRFPAIVLAGYHLPGTSYALHHSIWENRETAFRDHPLGGVLRVDLKTLAETNKQFYAFHERMENFKIAWDEESAYSLDVLLQSLKSLATKAPNNCNLTVDEASRLHDFVEALQRST